jgi:DNA-binding beta-propeller fold protein YncE
MHLFPDLVRLEKKYPNELVVIGVHSPKFDNEKDPKSIEKAMQRYEIDHPVINDAERKIWMAYGVDSWPTVAVIDPEGYVVAGSKFEHIYHDAVPVIDKLIRTHRAKRTLNEKPIHFTKEQAEKASTSPLYFPGKVLADNASKQLFIADSTHHRIVITDLDGKLIAIAGTGKGGYSDGTTFERAQFNDPQGMALDGDTLYVADRKNHMIRALDLKHKTVKTIAGIGHQGTDIRRGGLALHTGLNSPWDLLLHRGNLYVAMAGHHQIWVMDLSKRTITPFAGNGFENLMDGPRPGCCLAQPSGLAADGTTLYIADSEVSAIRAVPFNGVGEVSTLVGTGLFDFGDADGVGVRARLQHALGVVFADGKLYVADTYNSKIKVLDPATGACTTFAGADKKAKQFSEPGGISHADGKLYVADTNAHRIQVIDMETKQVRTLKLQGVTPPKP